MDEKEFRVLTKHYFMKGKTSQETKEKLDKHYGDSAPSISRKINGNRVPTRFTSPLFSRLGSLGLLFVPQYEEMAGGKKILFKRGGYCRNEWIYVFEKSSYVIDIKCLCAWAVQKTSRL
uniref:Mos1 transposase HTH domain-containing protein n=1 Tax=Rhodnius prolixus TaxID=13249 RepID=T1H825_RHOPR